MLPLSKNLNIALFLRFKRLSSSWPMKEPYVEASIDQSQHFSFINQVAIARKKERKKGWIFWLEQRGGRIEKTRKEENKGQSRKGKEANLGNFFLS